MDENLLDPGGDIQLNWRTKTLDVGSNIQLNWRTCWYYANKHGMPDFSRILK